MANLDDPAVRDVLAEGRQVHVAVTTAHGPHVTPELYAMAEDRLWFLAAATTVKAKVLRRDARAGAMVRVGDRAVVVTGTVELYDPTKLATLPRGLGEAKAVAAGSAAFGLRNAVDLAAFATDLVAGRLGRSLPPRRVLFAFTPAEVHLTEGGGDAVVGWATGEGPVALPATWDGRTRTGELPKELVGSLRLPSDAPACLVQDRYVAPGPAAKEGRILRGSGTLEPSNGEFRLAVERRSHWSGVTTWSEDVRQAG